ncbi:MauE/DoxX family redox-associated membrane protein [Chitinophaga sp. GbtcB8]|uniref:MauE/DoxX family redox-associated membrane protein n=1 Tax=Chitinophaga sp. GbtcB8 TaxID=2824753 RepID=UPI001C30CB73|nr:MauE/DoxX family redox-associated membrane protein [Chitinophaga sp. GbtcB8]
MLKRTIPSIVALLLVVLFLYTGISKLMEYTIFREQIGASPILHPIAPFIAWAIPLAEFAVAVLLFIPAWRLWGLYASFILMLAFTGYVITIVSFSKELPCSCGGVLQEMSWGQHIVFNSIMTVLALTGAILEKKRSKEQDLNNTTHNIASM